MSNWQNLDERLRKTLGLTRRPIGIAFRTEPPAGVAKFNGTVPSGCSFWRLAAQGRAFYTVPSDHYNCAIGSYTHKISLPPNRAQELPATLGFMTQIGYVREEEVPGIFQLPETPAVVVYAPLGEMPFDPDVALIAGRPGAIVLLQEAALRGGIGPRLPLLARPTCMALPAALSNGLVTSSGCVGNRVYTDIGEDEQYAVMPGNAVERIVDNLGQIVTANATLADYHRKRRTELATADGAL